MEIQALNQLIGNIDMYLLDQILKCRFGKEMRILDAGCGEGRNAHYFIKGGYQIFGVDQDMLSIKMARMHAQSLNPGYDVLRFQVCGLENLLFHKEAFDAVICSAVLHFAKSTAHFEAMWAELMRVLKPGGIFWLRTCTDAGGIQSLSTDLGDGRYILPDGSERFVLSEVLLESLMQQWGLEHLEAPRSVLVHRQRSMGVFLFQKQLS
ncbi:MAG: class I SAM-dependent methyltransferase [Lunatimonas sp.]|uniref:class I SAM-dependent methyltransferase n=1 Tax=Lunatimonas sp. TaxID=2060141 RepID=UPI00263B7A26|nr:class I SAM-dependent methyltransferase [Lunatimonas sp.]MCC5937347.1 class I SAM-dependent methyltransferase [Lunatimonas sp.]